MRKLITWPIALRRLRIAISWKENKEIRLMLGLVAIEINWWDAFLGLLRELLGLIVRCKRTLNLIMKMKLHKMVALEYVL